MKGYKCIRQSKIIDCTPCFFCKYRNKMTIESPCYGCIDTVDLALHKENGETEFANFEALSPEHLKVLKMEQSLLCRGGDGNDTH